MTKLQYTAVCALTLLAFLAHGTMGSAEDLPPDLAGNIQKNVQEAPLSMLGTDFRQTLKGVSISLEKGEIVLQGLHQELPDRFIQDIEEISIQADPALVRALTSMQQMQEGDISIGRLQIRNQTVHTQDGTTLLYKDTLIEDLRLPASLLRAILAGRTSGTGQAENGTATGQTENKSKIELFDFLSQVACRKSVVSGIAIMHGEGEKKQTVATMERIVIDDCAPQGHIGLLRLENLVTNISGIQVTLGSITFRNANIPSLSRIEEFQNQNILEKILEPQGLQTYAEEFFLGERPFLERFSISDVKVEVAGVTVRLKDVGLGRSSATRFAVWLTGLAATGIQNLGIHLPETTQVNAEAAVDFTRPDIRFSHLLDIRDLVRVQGSARPLPEQFGMTDVSITIEDHGGLALLLLNIEEVDGLEKKIAEAMTTIRHEFGAEASGQNYADAVCRFIEKPGTLHMQSRYGFVFSSGNWDQVQKEPGSFFTATVQEGDEPLVSQVRSLQKQAEAQKSAE